MSRPVSPSLLRRSHQPTLHHFYGRATRKLVLRSSCVRTDRNEVLILYNDSADCQRCWRRAGFHVTCLRTQEEVDGALQTVEALARRVAFACAFPPSSDLSIAGARWFEAKRQKDPLFQKKAIGRFKAAERLFRQLGCPFYIEGPFTGVLRKQWKAPTYSYNPCDFGGYLPVDDVHPSFPEILPGRDAYMRASGVWTGGGFRMPPKRPVVPEWRYVFCNKRKAMRRVNPVVYARKGAKKARGSPPRGFVSAVVERVCGRHITRTPDPPE